MDKTPITSPQAPPGGPYSPGLAVGDWMFLAGQTGAGETIEDQVGDALGKAAALLGRAGCTLGDAVSCLVHLSDLSAFQRFNAAYEKHFGEPMGWFFEEWVYGTETPHYDFSYDLKDGGQGKTILHVSLTQSEVSDAFAMKVPLYVQVNGTPRRLGMLSVKGSSTATADVPLPLRPEKVTADEYHSILCTMKQ